MNPRVPHVGTYRRELPVSLERLYENAIDWEHLPWLHRSSFSRIECIDAGDWGFRARVWAQPYEERRSFVIELTLDRACRRWITSTLEGSGAGTEIWTHAFSLAERITMVVVDFFVPGTSSEAISKLGEYYKSLYARLYDEDVWMMTTRERALDAIRNGRPAIPKRSKIIGRPEAVRKLLPLLVELGGDEFRLVDLDGEIIAHSTRCPHLLGPLGEAAVENGVIECPWHGYRFEMRSGRCVSGATCSLAPAPAVRIDAEGMIVLEI